MTVQELIITLKKFEQTADVLIANDEEMNVLYGGFEVAELENENSIVLFGLAGHEIGY